MSESGGLSFPIPLWADLVIAAGLTAVSAFFAGSTLGLLSLDKVGLQILAEAGTEKEKIYARRIAPLREKGNWLLCTLLIGNTITNSFLSILLASVSTGLIGLLVSTTLIVVVAEIIPQSVCSRHGLFIGAHTTWIIKASMILLAPAAWPLAFILDWVLGREVGTIYSKRELKHLISIHVASKEHQQESGLTHDDERIISGALDYKDKKVADVMTQLDKVFMLDADTKLDFEHMLEIYRCGYTRIPVFEGTRQNVIGILYTKDLILVDPDDEIELRTLVAFQGKASVVWVLDSTPLNEVFKLFKTKYTHLLVACRLINETSSPHPVGPTNHVNFLTDSHRVVKSHQNFLMDSNKVVTGVITLEDVLEEVIQEEIVDESDLFETNEQSKRVVRRGRDRPDVASYLALFEHKIRDQSKLSVHEVQAIAAFLSSSVKEFTLFTHNDAVLKGLIKQAEVVESGLESSSHMGQVNEEEEGGTRRSSSSRTLYRRGLRSCHFTLILQGHVRVKAGTEGFPSDLGPWSYLGGKAMGLEPYVPDFDAVSVGPCRLLRVHTDAYRAALRMGQANEIVGMRAIKQALSHTQLRSLSGVMARTAVPRPASLHQIGTTLECSESNEATEEVGKNEKDND